ncbi:alpha/beta fold hydrolase [Oleomonas cavernae]|nr:alpha/beta hydrolase [Oleomonas cavernae]
MFPTKSFTHRGVDLAYMVAGQGPPVMLLHGWPFHKASFRKLIPLLADRFTCYALDAAGMGESGWLPDTDFGFRAHAGRVRALADHLGFERYSVVGHDTGGTVARFLAAEDGARVDRVVVLDSECPGHRPWMIPPLQKLMRSRPGRRVMKRVMAMPGFARLALGGCFVDKTLLDAEFRRLFVGFWLADDRRFGGLAGYLCGIDFALVDELADLHRRIEAPVLFVWGARDTIFPRRMAERVAREAPCCHAFIAVEQAGFLAHEERPAEVARHIADFLEAATQPLPQARPARHQGR